MSRNSVLVILANGYLVIHHTHEYSSAWRIELKSPSTINTHCHPSHATITNFHDNFQFCSQTFWTVQVSVLLWKMADRAYLSSRNVDFGVNWPRFKSWLCFSISSVALGKPLGISSLSFLTCAPGTTGWVVGKVEWVNVKKHPGHRRCSKTGSNYY